MNDIVSCAASANDVASVPRIVAATFKRRRSDISIIGECNCEKPRIAGDLRVTENFMCHLRFAEVRSGHLLLYQCSGDDKECVSRIPLYNLNISLDSSADGHSHITLSKVGSVVPIVTLQVIRENEYNLWIKALVVEIIRQTPLNTLKFLDVLLINETLSDKGESSRGRIFKKSNKAKVWEESLMMLPSEDGTRNENHRSADASLETSPIRKLENGGEERLRLALPDVLRDLPETRSKCTQRVTLRLTKELLEKESVSSLVRLLTKCQIDKEYVPVREKRLLFESLSRFSFSVDNLKIRAHEAELQNVNLSKSLYDLHLASKVSVKSMRSYFENFNSESNVKEVFSE